MRPLTSPSAILLSSCSGSAAWTPPSAARVSAAASVAARLPLRGMAVGVIELHRRIPAYRAHEGIDIGGRLGAVIHVIGVLIHVEREDRPSAREVRRVIRGPAIDEAMVARRI